MRENIQISANDSVSEYPYPWFDNVSSTSYGAYFLNRKGPGHINTFLASGNFCRLLINFANSFDLDQDRQNVGPDLDPNRLTL